MKRLALITATLGLAATANAATVSYNFNNPQQTTEINQTGNLGLFDSNLGTLTGAMLTLSNSATLTLSATNTSAQTQNANLTAQEFFDWSSSLAALNPLVATSIELSVTTGMQSYAAGATRSYGPFTPTASRNVDLTSLLASIQASGGGAFSLGCTSLSGISILGGGGNISTHQSTEAGCGGSITYTYTARQVDVPEPGTLALLGLGIMGLGAMRRKRAA